MYNPKIPDKTYKIYQIRTDVDVESFTDGALVLRLKDRQMFEINSTGREVLIHTDGKRTTGEVAHALMVDYHITNLGEVLQDVIELYDHLTAQGIVEAVKDREIERRIK